MEKIILKSLWISMLVGMLFLTFSCKQKEGINPLVANQSTDNPLPSFNNSTAKTNILNFVKKVTDTESAEYVKPEDRIVCFDNDGTLWAEQPLPTQVFFSFDRIKALAKDHPEWQNTEPFAAVISNNMDELKKLTIEDAFKIVGTANAMENVDDFNAVVNQWINTAEHPFLKRPITKCVYQPMLELLEYLRANDFKIYIVSGGSVEFMRAFAPKLYGVSTEHVIGSSFKRETVQNGDSISIKQGTEFEFNDDHLGKVLNINKFIGKKPIMVVGNSDGDLEMMEYATTENPLPTFCLYINHDDAKREFDYTQGYKLGLLVKGKEEAQKRGWTIVNIKEDWNKVFPE